MAAPLKSEPPGPLNIPPEAMLCQGLVRTGVIPAFQHTPGTPTVLLGTEPTLLCSVVLNCRAEPMPGVQGSLRVLVDFGTKVWGVQSDGEGDSRVLYWGGGWQQHLCHAHPLLPLSHSFPGLSLPKHQCPPRR